MFRTICCISVSLRSGCSLPGQKCPEPAECVSRVVFRSRSLSLSQQNKHILNLSLIYLDILYQIVIVILAPQFSHSKSRFHNFQHIQIKCHSFCIVFHSFHCKSNVEYYKFPQNMLIKFTQYSIEYHRFHHSKSSFRNIR